LANRRIQRGKELSDYLRAMNEDVTKLNNRNYVTSIAANAIGSDQIGSDVVLDNKTISSSNYLPGISGWMIDGFGNSEFANVLVRGDINAYSGTIGYWNISQPLVSRTFGDYVLRGTLLESSNLGLTDDGVETGTYVGLFKSYVDVEVSITSISRDSEIATAIVLDHNYSVGDYIRVSIDEDSSFNTNSAVIVDISSTSFKYYSAGSDVVIAEATGFSILAIRDIAGLYLRDYSKAEFDYGYFSNTGVAYVSAEDVNLIENPSFEYIDSGATPVSSNVSWTAAAGSTFSLEQFNNSNAITTVRRVGSTATIATTVPHGFVVGDPVIVTVDGDSSFNNGGAPVSVLTVPTTTTFTYTSVGSAVSTTTVYYSTAVGPQHQYDSSYGGKVLWSSALSTYLTGKIDYLVGTSYNIFDSQRVLYLGMTMFPSYVATRSTPTAVARYNNSGSLYWQIDTNVAHKLSGGDTVLLDFDGVQFDPTYGEYIGHISRQNVTGGFTRTRTVLSSPAPTSTRFYVDSGSSFTATLGDGVTLINVDEIRAPNTTVADLGSDAYGTRPAYVYKVVNAAFNLSEIRFRFGNGSTVNISDVLSIDTRSNWDTESNKYLISDSNLYALGYNDVGTGIPYMYKPVQTIIDANALQTSYRLLDPTNYTAGTDIYIDIPAWMYTHDGAGYVSASPTKISSFTYILDNLYLSTTTKSFFGGSLPNVRWASSTVEDPSYDPAQASIEGTKQWINIDLDSQTAYLDYFNYVGFKQSNFSRSMLVSPNITTSDSISAKIVIPTDHETLTVTSGTYRYINNGGDYIDLVSSLKTVTGDRDTGFELVASKKYHSGVSETILAEETALIAGYWDESSSESVVKVKAERFVLSGQYTDYITSTASGTTIHGDLTVNGYTTTVNSTTVTVDDKNIELASTASPSDALADGAGITVKGTGDKTWSWIDATDAWTSNQDINIVSPGTSYEIVGTSVLNATTLGSGVVNSSLTKVGALSGGTAGFVKVDASGNLTSTSASASMTALMGFTTTVTSGTAVVLTNASTYYQQFTGSTAQTITLPVTSTLATGWTFHIVNNNTAGDLTVNSSGGNLVITVIPGTTAMVTCIATAGTGAANWEAGLTDFSTYTGTGSVALSISPTFTGTVNTNAITAGGLASFNNNISAFGTSTFWANQQLSLAVRNGTNYAGNLVQYSINDTTVTGGVTARGLLWAGTATGAENNFTYNLSATNPFLTSSTATFTVSTVQTYNPFAVGQRIIVSGASQAQYNGSWISTAVGGSSGAWTVTISSGSGTTPFTNSGAITATGTIALEPAAFFKAPSPGTAALVIKSAGTSGNATDPFRFFDSAGALKTYITSAGDFVAPAISAIWSITSSAQDATVNAMRTRTSLASGYKANLQTWESSTTVLAGINNRGQFFTGGTSVLSGATTATTAASAASATVATYTVGTVSTVNPYAIGQLITTAGFSAETYFNGTFYVTAIGGSSGAWTITIVGSGFTVASATVQGTITIPAQASITPASAGTIGLVVRGTTSQAANLFETQDSAGAIKFYVDSAGNSNFSSGSWFQNSTGKLAIGLSSSVIGLLIKGASGQGVDLLQLQNNGSTPLFKVDQNGFMVAGGATVLSNALISASIYGTTQVGVAIRGTSGQTADLLVLQNNSTTSVSGFDSASNLFVNNTYRGFSTIAANPANTTYWKIATLPISTSGTYDHIIVDALLDDSWGSNQKVHARVLLSNRNGLTYRYYLNGTVRTNSRITVYTEADGSESVYMQLAASTYSAFSYNITHGIAGVTIYKNPTSTTTAPTGTLAFDSGNIATYVPQMYVPYTGAPQIQGNSIAYLASPTFTSTSAAASVMILKGLASQVEDLTKWQNSSGTVLGGVDSLGQIYTGSTTPLTAQVGGTPTATAGTGSIATITLTSASNLAVGDLITASGFTTATGTYNTTAPALVTAVSNSSPFTISYAATGTGTASVFGTINAVAQASITPRSPGTTGLIIKSYSGQQNAPLQQWLNVSGTQVGAFYGNGTLVAAYLAGPDTSTSMTFSNSKNIQFFSGTAAYAGGAGVMGIANATTAPTSNPTGGGILYVNAGALTYRGTGGSAATIVNADGTQPIFSANNTFTGVQAFNNAVNIGSGLNSAVGLEMGYTGGAATTPFIDFHSGVTNIDFDSRIIASGGNGTNGQGTLTYTAATNTFTGSVATSVGLNLTSTASTITLNGSVGTSGQVLTSAGAGATPTWTTISTSTGTVTSVGLSLPTGLSVTPSSITTSGTFAVTYSAGYAIPTTASQTNWDTAFGWGNHASAGYLTTSAAASTYQPLDTDLTAIAALTGSSGFLKTNGAGTWSVDTATYLTSLGIGSSTQGWDADLDAISAISTTGILKRTGANTWATITDNSTNWDTAYGWGNHASAGYLTTRSYIGQTQATASGTNMAVTGITSITGATGTTDIAFNSAATTSAASGAINVITGTTTTSGTTGAVTVRSGNSAAASGAVTLTTGTSVGTTSGTLTLSTGSLSSGNGTSGSLAISTGAAGANGNSGAITMDVGTKTTGSFGTITIGGTNASAIAIGNATNTATSNLISSTSINLNSPAINSNAATLALLATPTTITAGAAATAVTIGASTGTLTLNNPTITTSVISGTLALFNTGLTGTLSIGGAAGTINIGASTTTKAINIGTATTSGNSSTIRIGTAQAATTSEIFLQGVVYVGKDVSGTGNQTGYSSQVIASSVSATGATGNATAGSLDIRSGSAGLSDINNPGTATSGNITMDVGSSSTTGGSPLYGTITIGQFNASAVNIGRSGVTTAINGSIVANTAATSTTSQLRLVTGTVPTTASQQFGMVSADAESIQLATTKTTGAGPGFGYIRAPQMVYAIANSGAATTTTPVSPFAAANDVLSSLEVNKYYRFRGVYYVTSTFTSGTATIQLAFTFANAPVSFKYNYKTYKSTGVTAFDLAGVSTTNAATTVSSAVTATGTYAIEFEGFFTSNATTGGSLTPQFQMSATGSSTIATVGSFFEVEKLNATGATTPGLIAGNWA
jgi:hypothetical protein